MSVAWAYDDDPEAAADRLVTGHQDRPEWLDAFSDALDRRRARAQLERFLAVWGLSRTEAASLFGVTRQALSKWLSAGAPVERAAALADLAAATDLLVHHLRRDRIPAVVRRPAPGLGGYSLIDLAAAGDTAGVRDACEAMFAFADLPA